MRKLNSEQVGALVAAVVGDGSSRPGRVAALAELIKALSFEEDAVARLNLYAEALDAMAEAEGPGALGLVVNGRTVRVGKARRVTH